jgi:hypothetical protein
VLAAARRAVPDEQDQDFDAGTRSRSKRFHASA